MEKLKEIFRKRPRLIAALVVVMALSLPFVVNQVLRQQDLRQNATAAPSISFALTPATKTVTVGDNIDVDIIMNASTNDIGSLRFTVKFDQPTTSVQLLDMINQPTDLKAVVKQTTGSSYEVIMVNTGVNPVTGNNLKIVSIRFKTLLAGTQKVSIDPTSVKATATDSDKFILVDSASPIEANYTISAVGQQVPTETIALTGTPAMSPTPENTISLNYVNLGGLRIVEPFVVAFVGPPTEILQSPTNITTHVSIVTASSPSPIVINSSGFLLGDGTHTYQASSGVITLQPNGMVGAPLTFPIPSASHYWVEYKTTAGEIIKLAEVNPPAATATTIPTAGPTATLEPTETLIPTTTISPGTTTLRFIASIPGIGKADGENHSPFHPNRNVTVTLSDFTTKAQIGDPIQTISSYDPVTGKYRGEVGLGTDRVPATGTFDVKIKMNNTLYRQQQGITITKGVPNQLSTEFVLVPSDLDQDNRISLNDYNIALACAHTPVDGACTDTFKTLADINDNRDNDPLDIQLLQRGFAVLVEGD